jgi:hypothetical protein
MIAVLALAVLVQSLPANEVIIESVGEAGLIVSTGDRELVFDHFPTDSDRLPDAIFVTNGNEDSFDQGASLAFMEQNPETPVSIPAYIAAMAIEFGEWPTFNRENREEISYRYYRSLHTFVSNQHAPMTCLQREGLEFLGPGPMGICDNGYIGWDGRQFSSDENVFYVLSVGHRVVAILGNIEPDDTATFHWERGFVPQSDIVVYPATMGSSPEGREFLNQWFGDSYQIAYRLPAHFLESDALHKFVDQHVLLDSGDRIVVDFGNQ